MLFTRSEAELVESAKRGDGGAFADLIRPHFTAAFRLAYGMLHDKAEAEDAVQDAAFTAWKKLGNLRAGAPLRPWFLAILANRCRHVGRNRVRAAEHVPVAETETAATDVAAGVDLRRALSRLGHDERLVLVLRYYLDLPYEEIASALRVTPKAARTRVERAVHRLRPILQVREAVT